MTIEEAWKLLLKENYKRTKNREEILHYFSENDRYHTASDVRNHLEADNPGISFDTIYRNLSLFSELGILEETELNGERHFRMQCDAGVHHHHFICLSCGKTRNIHTCPMDTLQANLPNYVIEDHKFEVYGKCPDCA